MGLSRRFPLGTQASRRSVARASSGEASRLPQVGRRLLGRGRRLADENACPGRGGRNQPRLAVLGRDRNVRESLPGAGDPQRAAFPRHTLPERRRRCTSAAASSSTTSRGTGRLVCRPASSSRSGWSVGSGSAAGPGRKARARTSSWKRTLALDLAVRPGPQGGSLRELGGAGVLAVRPDRRAHRAGAARVPAGVGRVTSRWPDWGGRHPEWRAGTGLAGGRAAGAADTATGEQPCSAEESETKAEREAKSPFATDAKAGRDEVKVEREERLRTFWRTHHGRMGVIYLNNKVGTCRE